MRWPCFGFLLIAAMLAAGVPCASAAHFSRAAGRFDCPGIGNSMNCAIAIEASLRVPFLHRSGQGRLDIKLMSGRVHSFVDVDVEGGSALYHHVLEVSQTSRYVIVHLQRYEWSEYGLLDRRSGRFTRFEGYPLLSPDERWLAVVSGHENEQPVFQIHAIADGGFRLAADVAGRYWWPTRVEWTSATSISYERSELSGSSGGEVRSVRARLQFDGSTWR